MSISVIQSLSWEIESNAFLKSTKHIIECLSIRVFVCLSVCLSVCLCEISCEIEISGSMNSFIGVVDVDTCWFDMGNKRQWGGQQWESADTVTKCKEACIHHEPPCNGFDFDSYNACYLHGPWSHSGVVDADRSGIRHYFYRCSELFFGYVFSVYFVNRLNVYSEGLSIS